MKRLFRNLPILLLLVFPGLVCAQPLLQVTTAYFTPDSTAYSTITNLTYIVENVGGTAFSGEVGINIGTPLIGADTVDSFLINLAPGDTVSRTSGVLVTPVRFNVGDNTVIIWPTARPTSGGSFDGIADTTLLHVFSGTFLDISGRTDLISWEAGPDHILRFFLPQQEGSGISSILVTDLTGRQIQVQKNALGYATTTPIYGLILAEVRLSDGRIWRKRIVIN